MGLPIPIPTVTPGPDYAQNEQSCFLKIDTHNHTTGNGAPVPVSGLDINGTLPMNGNSISNCAGLTLIPQTTTPSNNTVYDISGDLYFRNGSGSVVQITNGPSVAVSGAIGFTGLPSGTASASYLSIPAKFVFQSATSTSAGVDCGPIIVRDQVSSGNAVTVSAFPGLTSDYNLTLPPSNPAVDSAIKASSAGALSFTPFSDVQNPVGSMIMFGGSSAPVGWLICDGSVVSQSTYSALYSVIGASFNTGGEGAGNFRLPDFRRRVGVGAGGTGSATLGNAVGNSGGTETVTLTTNEMPSHTHTFYGNGALYFTPPTNALAATGAGYGIPSLGFPITPNSTGGGQPHNNLQPSLVVNYIIKT